MRRSLIPLLCGSALALGAVACSDDDETSTADSTPTTSATSPQDEGPINIVDVEGELEPGTYFVDPDNDPSTPLTVTFEITEDGWESVVGFASKSNDELGHTSLAITIVNNVVQDGCTNHAPADPAVGPTVDDLATALSQLPPFELTAPPTDVTLAGYDGKHLQLTVPEIPNTADRFTGCTIGQLQSWIDYGGAFYGYNAEPGRTEDYWILDVDGTRLAVMTNTAPSSPAADLTELQAIVDSIQIHP